MSNVPPPPGAPPPPGQGGPGQPPQGPPPGMPPQGPPPGGPPPGQPPGGGYGPPPGGGGFAPPPGGMEGGGGGGGQVDVMLAPQWGFKKFQEDMGTWLVLAAIPIVAIAIVYGVVYFLMALLLRNTSSFLILLLFYGVMAAVGTVLGALAARGLLRAGLAASRGERATMEHLTDMTDVGPYLLTALIVGAATGVGALLCVLPGIVVALVCGFAYVIQLDQKVEPIDAIKGSIELIKANPGPAILGLIVAYFVAGIGGIACGIGVIFTLPIGYMAQVHVYKQLRGEPIAP